MLIGVMLAVSCIAGFGRQRPPNGPIRKIRNYHLVFGDDFKTLDLGTVDNLISAKQHRWYEGVWFSREHITADHFTVANSALNMQWSRGQKQPDASVSTFSRNSPYHRAWRYGYFEARMKWTPVNGAWPAFWLIPVPPMREDTPTESGEIDVFEGQGSEPHTFFGTIHRWRGSQELASSSANNRFSVPTHADFANWHTYGDQTA